MPTNVWEYTLGDYRVLKKWLSHREEPSSVDPSMKTKLVISRRLCAGLPRYSSSVQRSMRTLRRFLDDGHAVRLATGAACRADIPNGEAAADFALGFALS